MQTKSNGKRIKASPISQSYTKLNGEKLHGNRPDAGSSHCQRLRLYQQLVSSTPSLQLVCSVRRWSKESPWHWTGTAAGLCLHSWWCRPGADKEILQKQQRICSRYSTCKKISDDFNFIQQSMPMYLTVWKFQASESDWSTVENFLLNPLWNQSKTCSVARNLC